VIDAISVRPARKVDVPILASMNEELIRSEGGPATLSPGQLSSRMAAFLDHGYEAHLVESGDDLIGYVLCRRDVDHVFIRQFYVAAGQRRSGVGRRVLAWMTEKVWPGERLVLQVRTGNDPSLRFWESFGFEVSYTGLEWSPASDEGQVR
jgi:ribosomal protein S18 acetylase RimI-like enzyme